MSEEKKYDCAFILMRHGMRAEDNPSAGLKTDDKTTEDKREPGENYIREAMEAEESDRPYERFFYAPPLVCKQTIQALIKHSPALITLGQSRTIQMAEELYSVSPEWGPIVQALGGHHEIGQKTLEDLCKAGDPKFILTEGERIFSFVQKIVGDGDMDFGVLSVMPSPLAEAVMLYLWERGNPEFRPPLNSRKMLNYMDYFVLVFMREKFEFGVRRSYWERILRKRKDKAFAARLQAG